MELKLIYQIIFILFILILFAVILYLIIKFKGKVSDKEEKIDINKKFYLNLNLKKKNNRISVQKLIF